MRVHRTQRIIKRRRRRKRRWWLWIWKGRCRRRKRRKREEEEGNISFYEKLLKNIVEVIEEGWCQSCVTPMDIAVGFYQRPERTPEAVVAWLSIGVLLEGANLPPMGDLKFYWTKRVVACRLLIIIIIAGMTDRVCERERVSRNERLPANKLWEKMPCQGTINVESGKCACWSPQYQYFIFIALLLENII